MSTPLAIRAFAAVQLLPHVGIFLATGDGDLDGPISAQATSEVPAEGGPFTMRHEFIARGGSRPSTEDEAVVVAAPVQAPGRVALSVVHRVVQATGRFAGAGGSFSSYGPHDFATGECVQRFQGELDLAR